MASVSVNKAIIIGNVGREPELRTTASGQSVCNFSVATSEKYNGEERTEWHKIVAWGKTAEACAQFLAKGSSVYVEGRIQTREWEKDGIKRQTTEIVAYRAQFLTRKEPAAQTSVADRERAQDSEAPTTDDFPF